MEASPARIAFDAKIGSTAGKVSRDEHSIQLIDEHGTIKVVEIALN
jgi:hypothetical protein